MKQRLLHDELLLWFKLLFSSTLNLKPFLAFGLFVVIRFCMSSAWWTCKTNIFLLQTGVFCGPGGKDTGTFYISLRLISSDERRNCESFRPVWYAAPLEGRKLFDKENLLFLHNTPLTHTHTPAPLDTHALYLPRLVRITYWSPGLRSNPIQHLGQWGKGFPSPALTMCRTVNQCTHRGVCACVCVVLVVGSEHDGETEINNDIQRTGCSPMWLAALIKIG